MVINFNTRLGCTDFSKNTEWALQEISQAVL